MNGSDRSLPSDIAVAAEQLARAMSGNAKPLYDGYTSSQIHETPGEQFMRQWGQQRESKNES